jgi:hypothetical protein
MAQPTKEQQIVIRKKLKIAKICKWALFATLGLSFAFLIAYASTSLAVLQILEFSFAGLVLVAGIGYYLTMRGVNKYCDAIGFVDEDEEPSKEPAQDEADKKQ